MAMSFAAAACAPKQTDRNQADCGFVQTVYGERVSWKSTAPIPLYVDQSFPPEMLPGLYRAIENWAEALGRPVFTVVQTGYQGGTPRQDGVNVVYWLKNWDLNKSTEQARTSIYWLGDQIREADVRINGRNFSYYVDQPLSPGAIHLESLLVHELGHVLGLKHRDDGGSVMATYLSSFTVRSQISKIDQDNLKCEYSL